LMGEGRGGPPRSSRTEAGHAVDCNSITCIGDARDNNISRWGSSRGTRAGQVTNNIHPGIIDKEGSLTGEGRGDPPRSSQTEVGHAVDCNSIMFIGDARDNNISRGDSSSSKSKSVSKYGFPRRIPVRRLMGEGRGGPPRSSRTEAGQAVDCNSITFIGDAGDNNKSRWGSSRGMRAGQVTNYIRPGIIDIGSSLTVEGRGGPPRSSRTEVGYAIDGNSIGDARDNHKSRWGSSRGTRAEQVTNNFRPRIIDKGSSLMGEGRGGVPRSSE
jgi:hypothetical protein